jgi:phosphatidate phosphatase PAH1
VQAVHVFAARGYKIVYLSLSFPGLLQQVPEWLARNGFPAGALHVPQSVDERNDPTTFKAQILKSYRALGWRLSYAFGDRETDFAAYSEVGIPRERVYAMRRAGRQSCELGEWERCLGGWPEFLATVNVE